MTTIVRSAKLDDFKRLDLQPLQLAHGDGDSLHGQRMRRLLEAEGEAWCMEIDDGKGPPMLMGLAGVVRLGPGRGRGWALVGKMMLRNKKAWVPAAAEISKVLTRLQNDEGWARIEAETPLLFKPGHALLRHLGFRFETAMPFCGPGGQPYALYARYGKRTPDLPTRYVKCAQLAQQMLWEDLVERPRHGS